MPERTTTWPFEDDATRDDPLTALRIPVTTAWPGWRYVATFDRMSEQRPTDTEAAMIASFIHEYIAYWFNDGYKQTLGRRPLDVDSGCNTTIFHKYADGDWGYRRDSWQHGPLFVPEHPRFTDRKLGPLTLVQVMDHVRTIGRGSPMPHWTDWKAAHPDVFEETDRG